MNKFEYDNFKRDQAALEKNIAHRSRQRRAEVTSNAVRMMARYGFALVLLFVMQKIWPWPDWHGAVYSAVVVFSVYILHPVS